MPRLVMPERVIVFGRYPLPGKSKTRLASALGPAGAADLQRELTERTLRTVRDFSLRHHTEMEFCFEGGTEKKIERWLGRLPIVSRQGEGNLGKRMEAALVHAFREGCARVVLLGTDIPGLRPVHLAKAFEALRENDLVLGPSTDGGYWLIGLRRPAHVFDGMDWGTENVLEQTVALAARIGLKVHQLDSLTDVDTLEDTEKFMPGRSSGNPYLSVIIPALNEAVSIRETIQEADDPDAEIIVVDGGSTDHTRRVAEASGATLLMSKKGRAAQQNKGAEAANGKVLLFLHADTRLPHRYVNHIFETLLPGKTAAGAFRFKTDSNLPLMKAVELIANFRSRFLQLPYGDQGLFLKRPLFDAVGGFPETPIAEDLLMVRRLKKCGRIRVADIHSVTSGRRWKSLGVFRTTWVNQIILAGCYLGISPRVLARLYRLPAEVPRLNPPFRPCNHHTVFRE